MCRNFLGKLLRQLNSFYVYYETGRLFKTWENPILVILNCFQQWRLFSLEISDIMMMMMTMTIMMLTAMMAIKSSSIDRVGSHGDAHRDGVFERFATQFGYARPSPRVVHTAASAATRRHLLQGTCHRPDVRHGRLAAGRAGRAQLLLLLLLHGTVLAGSRVHQRGRRTAAGRR